MYVIKATNFSVWIIYIGFIRHDFKGQSERENMCWRKIVDLSCLLTYVNHIDQLMNGRKREADELKLFLKIYLDYTHKHLMQQNFSFLYDKIIFYSSVSISPTHVSIISISIGSPWLQLVFSFPVLLNSKFFLSGCAKNFVSEIILIVFEKSNFLHMNRNKFIFGENFNPDPQTSFEL